MRYWFNNAIATCQFELLRSLTLQRIGAMIMLTLFPPLMLLLVITNPAGDSRVDEVFSRVLPFMTFAVVFLVALVCLLSLLLWATPNVQSELEGKSWSFVAVRPGGRIGSFLGKFLTAVLVSWTVSTIAATGCVLVANRYSAFGSGTETLQTWGTMIGIFSIACLVYGAIFSMLGTIFSKRAMVVSAGYLIGVEVLLSLVPAIVSRFTMSYHLRRLGEIWLGWFLPIPEVDHTMTFGSPGPVWMHLTCLGGAFIFAILAGMIIIVNRQYIAASES